MVDVIVGAGNLTGNTLTFFKLRIKYIYDIPRVSGELKFRHHVMQKGPISKNGHDYQNIFISSVGDPRHKRFLLNSLGEATFANLIHLNSIMANTARLGVDVLIHPYSIIDNKVSLRDHVTVCSHTKIGHGSRIGAYSTIAPGCLIGGDVTVGEGVFLGAGSLIKPGAKIGDGAFIGMGAVVIDDVPPNQVVVGNPARRLRSFGYEERWKNSTT